MQHLMDKEFVSLDLETLSTKYNAIIVSIGAVFFTLGEGIRDEFTININPMSCRGYGLHLDKETVAWWQTQPIAAQKAWQTNAQTLPDALTEFNGWLGNCKNTYMMSQGSVFDFSILRSAYEACSIAQPWRYSKEMDLRTIGIITNTLMSRGNGHTALGDAENQAEIFLNLFKKD